MQWIVCTFSLLKTIFYIFFAKSMFSFYIPLFLFYTYMLLDLYWPLEGVLNTKYKITLHNIFSANSSSSGYNVVFYIIIYPFLDFSAFGSGTIWNFIVFFSFVQEVVQN